MSVFLEKDKGGLMEEDDASGLDQVRKRIDAVIKEKPSHREALEFLRDVMTEQDRVRTKIKMVLLDVNEAKINAMMEGHPLLNKKGLHLDIPPAAKVFKRLCGLLILRQETSSDAKCVNQAIHANEIHLEELF